MTPFFKRPAALAGWRGRAALGLCAVLLAPLLQAQDFREPAEGGSPPPVPRLPGGAARPDGAPGSDNSAPQESPATETPEAEAPAAESPGSAPAQQRQPQAVPAPAGQPSQPAQPGQMAVQPAPAAPQAPAAPPAAVAPQPGTPMQAPVAPQAAPAPQPAPPPAAVPPPGASGGAAVVVVPAGAKTIPATGPLPLPAQTRQPSRKQPAERAVRQEEKNAQSDSSRKDRGSSGTPAQPVR